MVDVISSLAASKAHGSLIVFAAVAANVESGNDVPGCVGGSFSVGSGHAHQLQLL